MAFWVALLALLCPQSLGQIEPTECLSPKCLSSQTFRELFDCFYETPSCTTGLTSITTAVYAFNGTLLFNGSYGHRDVEKQIPATVDTIYNLGGVASLITSTGIMHAVENNANFTLSDSVDQLFKNASMNSRIYNFVIGNTHNYAGYPVYLRQNPILLRDLLLHAAGLDGASTRGKFDDFSIPRRTLDSYLASFGPRRVRDINATATWSNHGISYAALAVEAFLRINTSSPDALFSEYLERNGQNPKKTNPPEGRMHERYNGQILRPLDLNNTHLKLDQNLLDNPNIQHLSVDGITTQPLYADLAWPGSDMYGTAKDIARFAMMHVNGTAFGKTILRKPTIKMMQEEAHFSPLPEMKNTYWGVGIGWQKGFHGEVKYLECGSPSSRWMANIRFYNEAGLIHVTLGLAFNKTLSSRYIRSLNAQFIETFLRKNATCPGTSDCPSECCVTTCAQLVQENLTHFTCPDPKQEERFKSYVGSYIATDYPHTTWEKSSVYQNYFKKTDALFNVVWDSSYDGLTDTRGGCYVPIEKHLFYRGTLNCTGNSSCICLLPYPFQTPSVFGFKPMIRRFNENSDQGGTGPYERIALILRLRWDILILFYFGFYGLSLILVPIFGALIIRKHRKSQKYGIFIAIVLGTVAATCNNACNLTALSGLILYYLTGFMILNEDYDLPVLYSSADLFGFVFWFLAVGALLYCLSKKIYIESSHRQKTPEDYTHREFDGLSLVWLLLMFSSCCANLLIVFVLLQWNLFGPSHII